MESMKRTHHLNRIQFMFQSTFTHPFVSCGPGKHLHYLPFGRMTREVSFLIKNSWFAVLDKQSSGMEAELTNWKPRLRWLGQWQWNGRTLVVYVDNLLQRWAIRVQKTIQFKCIVQCLSASLKSSFATEMERPRWWTRRMKEILQTLFKQHQLSNKMKYFDLLWCAK